MPTINEVRAKYPQYEDLSDDQLADALHRKFYSDMPRETFNEKIGMLAKADADRAEKITGTGTLDDMTGSGIAKAVPFGDEIASGLNAPFRAAREWMQGEGFDVGRAYDRNMRFEEEMQRRREERSPVASTVGSVVGGLGASSPLIKGGATLLNGAQPTIGSLAGRGAAEGALYGAAYGAGEGRGLEERLYNAASGAGIGALTGGATGAATRPFVGAGKQAAPTVDDFMAAKSAAYKRAEDAGVVFTPQAMTRLRNEVQAEFAKKAYHPKLQGRVSAVLDELDRLQGQNVTLEGLDIARQIAGDAFEAGNKKNNELARLAANKIDDLVNSPQAGDILAGNAPEAAQAITEARKLYHQGSKLQKVNELFERGEFNAATSGSGGNLQNATRQQLKKVLTNKGWDRGFTDAEKKAIKQFVKGTTGQNLARAIGAASPAGNGLGKMLWGGLAVTNPASLVPIALGAGVTAGTKKVGEALTRKSFENLQRVVAHGGKAPRQTLTQIEQAIIQALTRSGGQQLPDYIRP